MEPTSYLMLALCLRLLPSKHRAARARIGYNIGEQQ